jgi:hypothetical protein
MDYDKHLQAYSAHTRDATRLEAEWGAEWGLCDTK